MLYYVDKTYLKFCQNSEKYSVEKNDYPVFTDVILWSVHFKGRVI